LKSNKNVLYVDLSNNNIGNNGAVAVEKLLKSNQSIISVNLSNNKIVGGQAVSGLVLEGFNFPNLVLNRIEPTAF